MRGVKAQRIECDEIWVIQLLREARERSDRQSRPGRRATARTWTALDADSKLIASRIWSAGVTPNGLASSPRDMADRVANRIHSPTDGQWPYPRRS